MLPVPNAYIGTLQVRGIGRDNPAFRLALANLLNTADLRPEGMAPSSVLIVRNMVDPLPGRLVPHQYAFRVDAAWERAVQTALEDCYRRAARPAQGFVPSTAEAVLFASPGEMLACLARDLSRGDAGRLWWWMGILRGLPAGAAEALVAAWCRQASYVPEALDRLSDWGAVISVLRMLSPQQAWTIFVEMARAFDNVPLVSSVSTAAASSSSLQEIFSEQPSTRQTQVETDPVSHGDAARVAGSPPWRKSIPDTQVPEFLGRQRGALLGVGLLLRRAPSVARSSGFIQAFRDWYRSAERKPVDAFSSSEPEEFSSEQSSIRQPHRAKSKTMPAQSSPLGSRDLVERRSPTGAPASPEVGGSSKTSQTPELSPREIHVREESGNISATERVWQDEGRQTELGGVLFLINMLHALDLPHCLDSHFGLGPQLSGWALLELLGRSLLGQQNVHLINDPLWTSLAELDGRIPGKQIGETFVGKDYYRLPPSWLSLAEGHGKGPLELRVRAHRLQLWHPEGFAIVDRLFPNLPSGDVIRSEIEQAAGRDTHLVRLSRGTRRHAGRRSQCNPVGLEIGRDLRRLLEFLLPYICWRLSMSLGMDDYYTATVGKALLLRRGRLYITGTHVDLVMDLDEVTLPVRLAGLDANPGWVPDLGRVVTFHFV